MENQSQQTEYIIPEQIKLTRTVFVIFFAISCWVFWKAGTLVSPLVRDFVMLFVPFVLMPILIYLRGRSIGHGTKWGRVLWFFVPGPGLWVFGRCLYLPEGYKQSKETDKAGRIIFRIYWLTVSGLLLSYILNN